MVPEEDLTLGCGHMMQYTNHVSQKCILETYINLLTDVTSINVIKRQKNKQNKKESHI